MKDIRELENKTFWEIAVNEGSLTQFVLGSSMLILSLMYLVMEIHYWFKFKVLRR